MTVNKRVFGITGPTGSGKSYISGLFSKKGVTIIDCDKIAREIVEPFSQAAQELREYFGDKYFDKDGNLLRREIANVVFSNKEKLLSVVRPDLTAKLYADDYYLNVRPTSTPTIDPTAKFSKFQFSILAAYPYWQKDENAKVELSTVEHGFKFPWNISKEYRFGTVTQTQFIVISNNGQLPVPFTMTL